MSIFKITRVEGISGTRNPSSRCGFSEVIISASAADYRLACDPDTDELKISRLRKRRTGSISILKNNHNVEWMWRLRNQQGYEDGFRIQVRRKNGNRSFDFIAVASSIEVSEAHVLPIEALDAT